MALPVASLFCISLACNHEPGDLGSVVEGSGEAGAEGEAGESLADEAGSSGGDASSSGGDSDESSTSGPILDVGGETTTGGDFEQTCDSVQNTLSSAGCLFAPFVGRSFWDTPWAVVAANAGENPATVTLYLKDGTEFETAVVEPAQTHVFLFEAESPEMMAHTNTQGTFIDTKVLRLESDVPIVAYQFNPYSHSDVASSDASLLLPAHTWDTDYYTAFYYNDGAPWMVVTSLEEDNQVTITPPDYYDGTTVEGDGLTSFSPGQPQTVPLGSQQLVKIRDGFGADFTGWHVESTKPVAVSVGVPTMSIPGPNSLEWRDYLEEQVPPRSALGQTYVGAKFHERGGEPDLYRFVADQDGTTITLSGGYTQTINLDAGDFAEVTTAESFLAEGDKPFLMEHLMVSQAMTQGPKNEEDFPGTGQSVNCFGDPNTTHVGDPAITFVPPVDQFRTNYTFLTPETYAWDYITVIARADEWDLVLLDDAPLPIAPTSIGAGDYVWGSFMIEDGSHRLVTDGEAKVGIEVYGFDCHISYAYPGGLNLVKINPVG